MTEPSKSSSQRRNATMLQRLDGAGALPQHPGDLLDGEIGDDPEREHVALIGSQRGEHFGDGVAFDTGQCLRFGVAAGRCFGQRIGQLDGDNPTLHAAVLVDQDPTRDGEHPSDEPGLIAAEVRKVAEHTKEHLAGDVFGIASPLDAQPAEHASSHRVVQLFVRGLRPAAGPGKRVRKGIGGVSSAGLRP
jgi:hypothetical protein